MKRHTRADFIIALAEGKTLQIKGRGQDDKYFTDYVPAEGYDWYELVKEDTSYDFRVKPEPKTGWINVYAGDQRGWASYLSREQAEAAALPGRVACVKWTEGDGL